MSSPSRTAPCGKRPSAAALLVAPFLLWNVTFVLLPLLSVLALSFHKMSTDYEVLPGWNTDITDSTQYGQLPAAAKGYVRFLEETTGVTISVVGVGPGREQFVRPS